MYIQLYIQGSAYTRAREEFISARVGNFPEKQALLTRLPTTHTTHDVQHTQHPQHQVH